LGSGPAALTKTRCPSVRRSRAATPGEKPADWSATETAGLPNHDSTAALTASGTSYHPTRKPDAAGELDPSIGSVYPADMSTRYRSKVPSQRPKFAEYPFRAPR
jgi:hypothetical protein